MASAGTLYEEQRRWVMVGIGLNTVLPPVLRDAVKNELDRWHGRLCQPPDEIDKQDSTKYKNRLPPSKKNLQYKNINNNKIHKLPKDYDYAVRDSLALARLFLEPHMAHASGFDKTMDMSALLTVMGEADPFRSSGVADEAKKVRSDIRNAWAHCNFSEWTLHKFETSFQAMKSLVECLNLPTDDKKSVCESLDCWTETGMNSFALISRLPFSQKPFQHDTDNHIVRRILWNLMYNIRPISLISKYSNNHLIFRHNLKIVVFKVIQYKPQNLVCCIHFWDNEM